MTDLLNTFLRLVAILVLFFGLVAGVQIYRNSGTDPLPTSDEKALRLATYNVHYISVRRETGDWSLADWDHRKGPLDEAFKFIDADLVAFQEMESHSGPEESQENLTLDFLLANNCPSSEFLEPLGA